MNYLLDTSALKWAYVDGTKFCRRCRYIMSRSSGRVYIAEITILEVVSALSSLVRGKKLSVPGFFRSDVHFWRDVAQGRLQVVPLPVSEFEACRHLLMLAGVDSGRNLKTQDAMVAYSARRLALERQEQVLLLTSDKGLANIVSGLPMFSKLVKAEYLDPNP